MKHRVYLCQFNHQYGNSVFLPYSVGLIQAYCKTIEEIDANFDFKGFLYRREDLDLSVERLEQPDVVGISSYIWNWEYSKALARSIKARYPDCLVVVGGPQVPLRSQDFFAENPSVDLLVHFEGEVTFSEVLLEYLKDSPDYTRIDGLSVKVNGNRTHRTPNRERITNLELVPSPYTSGVFDDLMSEPYSFNASQETHRGCPYSCTFCDWGFSAFVKVTRFSDERIEREHEWFGRNRIEFLHNCDANYGLLPRDYALTEKLAATKGKYGFPGQFRAAYAKKSNMKIFEIAKVLNNAGLNKGVTLSMQSMDAHTLDLIKRTNIRVTDFENLVRLYRQENIATYTELIMGLPGETYDTFLDGVDELLRAGQHDSLNIYLCMVLPNSEMANPDYASEHELETVRQPILLHHSSPHADPIGELNDVVIGSKTLPREDWKRTYMFSWAVQAMHSMCLTQYVAIFLHHRFGVSYRTFYEKLVEFAQKHPSTLVGEQFDFVSRLVDETMQGGSWAIVMPEFGQIIWPTEEATFLKVVCEKTRFYREISKFVKQLIDELAIDADGVQLGDVMSYQQHMVLDPFTGKRFSFELDHNLTDYFRGSYLGENVPLKRDPHVLTVDEDVEFKGDLVRFATQIVWYGRKGGRFRHENVVDEMKKLPLEEPADDRSGFQTIR
jgi:radical SAM superfamily enzyme YgiQ (UPF0313 family)